MNRGSSDNQAASTRGGRGNPREASGRKTPSNLGERPLDSEGVQKKKGTRKEYREKGGGLELHHPRAAKK